MTGQIILYSLISYLLGSIPTAYWTGKIFRHIDIREYGSKNSGTTNTLRVLGLKYAIPVLTIDILKGYAATMLVYLVTVSSHSPEFTYYKIIFGLFAAVGHIFPVYAGFRGGKGIATLTGAMIGISFPVFLVCLVVFLVSVIITKYVSASSIIAAFALPFAFLFFFGKDTFLLIFALFIIALVLFSHRKNIKRLMDGEENRISFTK